MEELREFKDLNLAVLEANKQSDELSRLLDTWDKKIGEADKRLQEIEQNNIFISKDLVKLRNDIAQKRQQQLDLEAVIKMANHNIRELRSQKSVIERAFWRSR